jgi:HEAT repeat protein
MKPDGRSKSAAELMAELASDPALRAMQQRRATERLQVEAQLASAEQPLLEALGQQGVRLFSVWELVNSAQTPAALIPTLCEHLAKPYPSKVREAIARALAVPASLSVWTSLESVFETERDPAVKWAVHLALAAAADRSVLDRLLRLALDRRHGRARALLAYSLGRMRDDERAAKALRVLTADTDIGVEAKRASRGLGPRA